MTHNDKARAFWSQQNKARHTPGHCTRCGKPHDGPRRQCDFCKKYYQALRAKKRSAPMELPEARTTLIALERRVASLENAVARLQLDGKKAYSRGYTRGLSKGRGIRARNHEGLMGEHSAHKEGCVTSFEELSQLNHEYATA